MFNPNNQPLSYNQAQDICNLMSYAISKGFQTVSAGFDDYVQYPNRMESYYSVEADSMRFAGTYESIIQELVNTPRELIESIQGE